VRKNVLALSIFADVIRAVFEALKGSTWASPSTLKTWFPSRILLAHSVTAESMQVVLHLKAKSKLGLLVVAGSRPKNCSKCIYRPIQSLGHKFGQRSLARKPLDYVPYGTYLKLRDGEVFEHFPTAEPSATVEAVARDLFEIVCTLLNCASNAGSCLRLASSAYLLRRFALTCKEGAHA